MDDPRWMGGMSLASIQIVPSPPDIARKAQEARRATRAKRTPKSGAGSPAASGVKQHRKPGTTGRAASRANASAGRRANSANPEAFPKPKALTADGCRQRINTELQPARIVQLTEECERIPLGEALAGEIRRTGAGARQAMEAQRVAGMSVELFSDPDGNRDFHALVRRAARADMDAAHHIADAYKTGMLGVPVNSRRMEQWLRFAAELGDGRASWELAEHFNHGGLIAEAAKYEKRAQDLGYRPGLRLPTRGY